MTTHLLANDNYSVLVSEAGTGYSRWRDLAVTRWREDPTADALGFFVFLRDVEDGTVWSAGYQPSGREPDRYEVSFSEERARIIRRDGPLQTATDILVAPNDDAEVRRVSITNEGKSSREIEVDELRRGGAGDAGRRRRAPRVLEDVRADRIRCRRRHAPRDPPQPRAE